MTYTIISEFPITQELKKSISYILRNSMEPDKELKNRILGCKGMPANGIIPIGSRVNCVDRVTITK